MTTITGGGPPVDLDALARWMDHQDLGHGPIDDLRQLGGGTQNVVVAFTRAGREFVLRKPPEHKRKGNDETMRREARILSGLAGTDVPHPKLIAACDSDEPLGSAFYLMEHVDGLNPLEHTFDEAANSAIGMAMIDALAALAAVDVESTGLGDLGRTDGWLERQPRRWTRRLESYANVSGYRPPGEDVTSALAEWLTANQPSTWRLGLVHGDYHIGNVLVHPEQHTIAAVLDWELASVGDPLLDLAQLLVCWPVGGGLEMFVKWPGLPTCDELVARYASLVDRDLDDLDWFRVLAGFRYGAILEGTYARALAGKAPRELGEKFRSFSTSLFASAYQLCH